jgi:large subunit ribosomal protein L13Ae
MFEKLIVVDGKDHVLGRLASYVAKELINGQRVVVVRAERIILSGSLFRRRVQFHEFLNKRMLHNPRRALQHYRSPSRLFWKAVRGMLPHKTPRGAAAMGRFKVFDGVPSPFDRKKRLVVPDALRAIRLKSDQDFTVLGKLCSSVGWKKENLIEKLETVRKARSQKYYEKKVAEANRKRAALNLPKVKEISAKLAQYGY